MSVTAALLEPGLRRFPLRRRDIDAARRSLRLVVPESSDALLRAGWNPRDIPHWADVWPASVGLARALMRGPDLSGFDVIDLGCGCGVAGVAAAARGAAVTFLDRDRDALAFADFNARQNGSSLHRIQPFDWTVDALPAAQPGASAGRYLLLADVAYEYRALAPLGAHIESFTADPGHVAWFVDPERPTGNDLIARLLRERDTTVEVFETSWRGLRHRLRLVKVGALAV